MEKRPESRGASCGISACSRPERTEVAPTAGRESSPLLDDDDDDWHIPSCFTIAMSRLRPSPTPTPLPPSTRPLRVVAAGTLFLTHVLSLPTHPGPGQAVRAHEYARSRGGSAPAVLSVLSQLNADKCWLVASLGGAHEARAVARELEAEGVSTRYCKVWEGAAVPAAWVLDASELFASLYEVFVWRERQNLIWWYLSSDCLAYICGGATRNPYVLVFHDRIHMFGRREAHINIIP